MVWRNHLLSARCLELLFALHVSNFSSNSWSACLWSARTPTLIGRLLCAAGALRHQFLARSGQFRVVLRQPINHLDQPAAQCLTRLRRKTIWPSSNVLRSRSCTDLTGHAYGTPRPRPVRFQHGHPLRCASTTYALLCIAGPLRPGAAKYLHYCDCRTAACVVTKSSSGVRLMPAGAVWRTR